MTEIPEDVMRTAEAATSGQHGWLDSVLGREAIARAILAERKRCADWCDKTAFLEWEQGELRAQRALQIARDNILSGDDA